MSDYDGDSLTSWFPKEEIDYDFWLSHDLLSIVEMSFIAACRNPINPRQFFKSESSYYQPNRIYQLLYRAVESQKIQNIQGEYIKSCVAPPAEWLKCLMEKEIELPQELLSIAKRFNSTFQLKPKREKNTRIPQELREDNQTLEAVFKIMLDLYPNYPKSELIMLKPVQIYANGKLYTKDKLLNMVSEIEGKKREGGRPNNKEVEEMKKKIPSIWLEKTEK